MTDSIFNPEEFLDQVTTEKNDTKVIPVPEDDYMGISGKPNVRTWTSKDKSSSGVSLDLPFEIDDEKAKAVTGRDKVIVRYSIGLDVIDVNGKLQLDMRKGKNVKLGRLREVFDLNVPGQPFGIMMLQGRVARISVTQRAEGEDIFNDVKNVSKM